MDKNKLRFLATGDFHSDISLPNEMKNKVDMDSIDFILFTGDLSDRKDDFKLLLEHFDGKQIFFIPGNHETKKGVNNLVEHYNVHLLGNAPINFHDKLAIFGTNYLHIGHYGVHEQEVFENLIHNFKAVEHVPLKIHVCHIPPIRTEIGDMSPFHFVEGSEAQRAFLDSFSPQISLCGHIHESSGLEEMVNDTRLVNVGRTFKVIEVDLDEEKIEVI